MNDESESIQNAEEQNVPGGDAMDGTKVVAAPVQRVMPPIVVLANQKGGVGKTTTTINLAACLADKGKKILMVDMDPQCNATSGIGVPQQPGRSAYRALLGEGSLADIVVGTRFKNLDIVPSEVDLAGAEVDMARADRYLHRFSGILQPLLDETAYDFVIVDCPPSLGILTMNALTAARSVIIPMQCEYYAMEGLTVMTNLINRVRESGANPHLEIEGILMTMYDGRTRLSAEVVNEVKGHFDDLVYKAVIPRNVRLSEAPSFGLAAIEYDASSSGAKAYKAFANEFLRRYAKPHPAPSLAPGPTVQ
jgi:chromosome partitioning protein